MRHVEVGHVFVNDRRILSSLVSRVSQNFQKLLFNANSIAEQYKYQMGSNAIECEPDQTLLCGWRYNNNSPACLHITMSKTSS